ncbi:MAG: PIN domain-containing protein [Caldilineaceae bacterium]|nr:PIN domain-containing protein [Caldilineaceae bacterium]
MNVKTSHQFIDTNILVYAHDASSGAKHGVAQSLLHELWHTKSGCASIQVLQEFYVTVTRKVAKPYTSDKAAQIIYELGHWQVHSPTVEDIQAAISTQSRYNISFWDAMIVRSAVRLGCETLWSEDLNAGQRYETVLVQNPFHPYGT